MPKKTATRKTPRTIELCGRFGRKVESLRSSRKMSQHQLAAETGLDQGFISRVEAGRMEPCLGSLDAFADAFGVSIAEMLKGI